MAVSELIQVIETGSAPSENHSSQVCQLSEITNIYQEFLAAVQPLEKRVRVTQTLQQEQEELSELQGADQIFQALRQLEEKRLPSLELDAPPALPVALSQIWEAVQLAREPKDELEAWWKRASVAQTSPKRFEKFRRNWVHLISPSIKTTMEAEYILAVSTLRAAPLRAELASGAAMVLDALAAHYCVDGASDEWYRATTAYRDYLVRYLAIVCETAPMWLLAQLPELQVQDVVTPTTQAHSSFEGFLDAKPGIAYALQVVEPLRRPKTLELRLHGDLLASQHLAMVRRDLQDLAVSLVVSESDWRPARETALLQLRQWRKKLETDIEDSLTVARRKDPPKKSPDTPLWTQLMSALDDYDRVVESIVYPHLRDPLVRQVRLSAPVTVALDLERSGAPISTTQRLRKRLDEAAKSERQSADLWNQLRSEVVSLTPAGQLAKALAAALTKERLDDVLGEYRGQTAEERVKQALDDQSRVSVLERLDDAELTHILGALGGRGQAEAEIHGISKQQKIDWILSKIGLYDGRKILLQTEDTDISFLAAQTLQAKWTPGEYDVFLAHNAKDKPIVLQIGRLLMRRGIYPWIDIQQVPPGRWFQDVTQAAMTKVKSAAIFLGPHGVGRWQAVEIRAFISQCLERGIPVIPVLLPSVTEIPWTWPFSVS